MDENKLLNEIKKSAQHITVPQNLHPDNIKNMLIRTRNRGGKLNNCNADKKENILIPTPVQSRKKLHRKWIPAAALIALAAIGFLGGYSYFFSDSEERTASSSDYRADAIENEASGSDTGNAPAEQQEDSIFGVDSYELVYDTLAGIEEENFYRFSASTAGMEEDAVSETATVSGLSGSSDSSYTGFSETNIQEAGVDEADIIKTDGDYIYILKGQTSIQIISAKGVESECIASIQPDNASDSLCEFYVDGDLLSIISNSLETTMRSEDGDDYYYEPVTEGFTKLSTYDISDRKNPVLKDSVKQSGYYTSSRKVGHIIYLFTQYYPDTAYKESYERYIPTVNDDLISAADICIPEHADSRDYLVISAVDTENPGQIIEKKAILSAGSKYYVSQNNIYVYQTDWSGLETQTTFMKFCYKDGKISYRNICSQRGYVKDRFSMNEYQGYLRVVMTSDENVNALYVLNRNMETVGAIQDIAQGETIQSARFLGSIGYFVTYKNMDPLFSVDLSDPENPKLLGSLKITGFSSYLHFYGDHLLLGIGQETDPDTGEYYGIKLSMFDISDPANVTEVSKYVLEDSYDCPPCYNSKALLIDTEKNIFGFALDEKYMIFSYDEKEGFVNQFTYTGADPDMDAYYNTNYNRSCFADHILYLSYGNTLHVYDMEDGYRELTSVSLN